MKFQFLWKIPIPEERAIKHVKGARSVAVVGPDDVIGVRIWLQPVPVLALRLAQLGPVLGLEPLCHPQFAAPDGHQARLGPEQHRLRGSHPQVLNLFDVISSMCIKYRLESVGSFRWGFPSAKLMFYLCILDNILGWRISVWATTKLRKFSREAFLTEEIWPFWISLTTLSAKSHKTPSRGLGTKLLLLKEFVLKTRQQTIIPSSDIRILI